MFQLKSENPLPITFDIEGPTEGREIEPLLLLPLIENALKHGDLEANPAAFLRILLRNEPARLYFSVENSFDPRNFQKDEQGGVGLENIRQRVALQHRGRYTFETMVREHIFSATLTLAHEK